LGGNVPLSEHEQRQLEQIEQALYADYPKLAQAVRARDPRVHYQRRMMQAMAGFLVGVAVLVAGAVLRRFFPWMAVGGLAIMVACAMWALNSWRHMLILSGRGLPGQRGRRGRRGRVAGGPSFMERLEERWRRRQERGQF
jgi:hypothetical protein